MNNAAVLAQADVGLAICSGTDVAKETGDVILIKDNIRDVVVALEIAQTTMRKVKQNPFWVFIYNCNRFRHWMEMIEFPVRSSNVAMRLWQGISTS